MGMVFSVTSRGEVRVPDGAVVTVRGVSDEMPHDKWQSNAKAHATASTAHDLVNLLVIARLCLQRMRGRLDEDNPLMPLIDDASLATRSAGQLVRRMLDLAAGRTPAVAMARVRIEELISANLALMCHAAQPTAAITTQFSAGDAAVMVDALGLQQTLLTLVTNARDAMPYGGAMSLSTRVLDPCAVISGGFVEVALSDQGCGMSAAVRERALEPFFTTKHTGTGLGLSQVRDFTEGCGGELRIRSAPGEGTTVTMVFPMLCSQRRGRANGPD